MKKNISISSTQKNKILEHIGIAFVAKNNIALEKQIEFCREKNISHIQLQHRYNDKLSEEDIQIVKNHLKECPNCKIASHISTPVFNKKGNWLNQETIEEDIRDLIKIPVNHLIITPGKFNRTNESINSKMIIALVEIMSLAKNNHIVTCLENASYRISRANPAGQFGISSKDLVWLRSEIVKLDHSLEPFCKFAFNDNYHVTGKKSPRMTPEKFANEIGWENIAIINTDYLEHFKNIYEPGSGKLLKIFNNRMRAEPQNENLQKIGQLIKNNPDLLKEYKNLLSYLDNIFRTHTSLSKDSRDLGNFWKAYLNKAKHYPEIYLEVTSKEDFEILLLNLKQ